MKFFPLLLVLPVLLGAQERQTWTLAKPLPGTGWPTEIPRSVLEGPFELQAELRLATLDGTAASIKFGDALNFGFDSRDKTLFVEGRSIEESPKALAPTADHIQARKKFPLLVTRDADDLLTIKIRRKTVHSQKLPGSFPIIFRPHRNSMDIESVTLTGQLAPALPPLSSKTPLVPLLNNGQSRLAQTVRLHLDEPALLERAEFRVEGPVQSITMGALGTTSNRVLELSDPLSPGDHDAEIRVVIATNAPLLTPVTVHLEKLVFEGGFTLTNASPVQALRLARNIHQRGAFDCHTFRIPGVARTPKGTLLGVYDMRYNSRKDLQEHMDIGLSRSTDGGETWARPRPIMDMGEFGGKPQKENGVSDPNILVDRETGRIFVSACWTHGKPGTHQWAGKGSGPGHGIHETTQFMVTTSDDDGQSWSELANWTKLKPAEWWLFAPAPGNGIQLDDGTLIMPTQGRDAKGHPFSNLMSSKDHGETWTLSAAATDNTSECSVAELSDGRLMLNIRDNRNRARRSSDDNGRAVRTTRDFGKTWETHPSNHGALPEPVCMASLIHHDLPGGRRILLFSNPHSKQGRKNMTIQVSFDDGLTWPEQHHVRLDEQGGAYSSLVMVDEQTVGILYESSQADLLFQKVSLAELLRQPSIIDE